VNNLPLLLLNMGRSEDAATAKEHLANALRLLLKGHGEQHPWVVAVKKQLAELA